MNMWRDLFDLYTKGGLEVVTFLEPDESPTKQSLLIRTVVQPDADVIMWVRPDVTDAGLWERHQRELWRKIRSMQRVRWLLKYAGFLLLVVPFTIFNVMRQELPAFVASFVLSFVAALLLRQVIAFALRFYIRNRLARYTSRLRTL